MMRNVIRVLAHFESFHCSILQVGQGVMSSKWSESSAAWLGVLHHEGKHEGTGNSKSSGRLVWMNGD